GGYTLPLGEVLEALGQVDAEVVATVPLKARQDLGTVPSNVRLVDYVPLHALAATSTATINHSGFGSALTCLEQGLPQVLFTDRRMFDTPELARRITGAGAAVLLESGSAGPEDFLRAAERALTETGLTERSASLGEWIRTRPTPAAVAAELERIAHVP
ncbi:nucleotide disphospho-sugar-binding domain-containing protein, partial [Nocardiopsis alba]